MIDRSLRPRPRGLSLVEVLIVVAIVLVVAMMMFAALPRSRENARLVACTKNLGKIGEGLALYSNAMDHLPTMPGPGERGPGPLAIVVGHSGFHEFGGEGAKKDLPASPFPDIPPGRPVRGFICPSDSNYGRVLPFPAPTSYRGCTGATPDGLGGVFAFGKLVSGEDVEKGAGKDFTAAFSERRLGSRSGEPSPASDYQVVPGLVGPGECPGGPPDSWRNDAGSSWVSADWTSTLYNHAMPPNAVPSCVASDGRSARMGASSYHANRVNVLMVGGSVRGFTPTVDPEVWKKFGPIASRQ